MSLHTFADKATKIAAQAHHVVLSTAELNVTAVYTATDEPGGTPALDVERIQPRILLL
jgi:hypothetical protein